MLATAVLLSVPAFAVCSLVHGGASRTPDVELARGDDPIRNGLRIVDAPEAALAAPATRRNDADAVLVTDWMFTDGGHKGKPSPYQ
jgi:hypothetical protein